MTKKKFHPTHEHRVAGGNYSYVLIPNELREEFDKCDFILWRLNAQDRWEVIPFDTVTD